MTKVSAAKISALSGMRNLVLLSDFPAADVEQNIAHLKSEHQFEHVLLFNQTAKKPFENKIINHIQVINFSPADFDFFGRPKKHLQEYLNESSYHLLLNTSHRQSIYLDYIAAKMYADLKVGFGKLSNATLYPVNIYSETPLGLADCISHFKKYIDALSGKKSDS